MNLSCRLCGISRSPLWKKNSRTFLGIVSFLVSENIPELLFEFKGDRDPPEDLEFCTDEFRYD
jgi:hypothetical protein